MMVYDYCYRLHGDDAGVRCQPGKHNKIMASEYIQLQVIGASLSEPHTSVIALQDACVCLSVCLSVCLRMYVRPYTENFN